MPKLHPELQIVQQSYNSVDLHKPKLLMTARYYIEMAQYSIFCMGNALLDMLVTSGEELLQKYGLKANDAILAEEKHCAM
jgi:hypothetical protein